MVVRLHNVWFQIQKGEISFFEFDHCVTVPAMMPFVNKLRSILKEKFPDLKDGKRVSYSSHVMHTCTFSRGFSALGNSNIFARPRVAWASVSCLLHPFVTRRGGGWEPGGDGWSLPERQTYVHQDRLVTGNSRLLHQTGNGERYDSN